MIARRLLMAAVGGGTFTVPPYFPTDWNVTEFGSNPIIPVSGGETQEQYDPAVIILPSGDIWAYVKGAISIYAYLSTDDGETFVAQNGGSSVILPGSSGAWDDTHALEAAALYDDGTDTIHLWYKGSGNGGTTWHWGHATAPGSDPTDVTKDAGNPILTSSTISTALGGLTVSDTAPFDVVVSGGTTYFYGYAAYNGRYRIILATGSDYDDPGSITTLLNPPNDATIAVTGSVFQDPASGLYGLFYTWGPLTGSGRSIRVGQSTALGSGWDFSNTTDIIAPSSGWESYHVYTPRILREGLELEPFIDGMGRWKLYYSGADAGWVHSQTGLAYLEPA